MGDNKVESLSKSPADNNKYGEPKSYDPTFNGPIKKRGCTDIICMLLFLICFLGTGGVAYVAYVNGNPALLLYPADSNGHLCGSGEYLNKPYLFFFDLIQCARVGPAVVTNGCPTEQICVAECPKTYWSWLVQLAAERTAEAGQSAALYDTAFAERGGSMLCKYGVDPTNDVYKGSQKLVELIENGTCASYFYPQEPVVGRCLPSFLASLADGVTDIVATIGNENVTLRDSDNKTVTVADLTDGQFWITQLLEARNYAEKFYQDAVASQWFILGGLVLSMLISFLWIVIMRWIAGIMVWVTIILFLGLFGGTSAYSYLQYYDIKNTTDLTTQEWKWTLDYNYYLGLGKVWLVFGCTSATIFIVLLLVILFLINRIRIAIALLKEGSRAIGSMVFTLIWPIWPFVLQAGLVCYWGITCLYLASTTRQVYGGTNTTALNGTYTRTTSAPLDAEFKASNYLRVLPQLDKVTCDATTNNTLGTVCNFVNNEVLEYTIYLQVYMLFMYLWVMNWIIGFGQMVLAGAFASYYWAYDKSEHIPMFPILSSVGRTLFFHTGTIAFGALIIAIIQMIRIALEYLDAKLKGSENMIAKFFLKCLKCCFWCLEKFMKMINKNAYIMTAIYGKNFCTAAKDAFFLLMRNIIRVAVVDKVADFILFISKLVVVGALALLSFLFFSGKAGQYLPLLQPYQPTLNFFFVPCVIIAVASFVIAWCFFSVYGMAVDTLFLCFLEDLERNDGSMEKPYYMSKELKSILGKKNVDKRNED